MEKFNETKDKGEDELIIGPGIQAPELRELRLFTKSFNLLSDSFRYQDGFYLLIYEKIPWKKMVEVLKTRGRPYGRFVLVDREELPKHKDIAVRIVKTLPKGKKKTDENEDSDDELVKSELDNVNEPGTVDD